MSAQKLIYSLGLWAPTTSQVALTKIALRPSLRSNPIFELKTQISQLSAIRTYPLLSDVFVSRHFASFRKSSPAIRSQIENKIHETTAISSQKLEEEKREQEQEEHEGLEVVNRDEYVPVRFDSIKAISPQTQEALKRIFKYKTMSKVQNAVLSQLPITGDLFIKAKTGTGKTLAFLIPAIETTLANYNKDMRSYYVSVMAISPTRELAQQIAYEAKRLLEFYPFEVHCLVGGEPKSRQIRDLMSRRVDVIVGTPGRLMDLLEGVPHFRKQCTGIQTLILDEADQLLELGFRQDIEHLIQYYPKDRQTFLLSATISPEIRKVANFVLREDRTLIDTVDPNDVNTNIQVRQSYVTTPWDSHLKTIRNIILNHKESHRNGKIIMFLPTRRGTELYAEFFRIIGDLEIFELQSGLSQQQRTRVSDRFRRSKHDAMLVTSDVSARGVDYPGVTLVLQIGAASSREQYIHRLGRTGRAGREGEGISVLAPFESFFTRLVENLPIKQMEVTDATKGDDHLERAIETIDIEMVDNAYKAFLGYYMGKSDILNIRKSSLLDHGSDFCQAFGVSNPPALSTKMMESLGILRGPGRRGRSRELPFNSERRPRDFSSYDRRDRFGVDRRDRFDFNRRDRFGVARRYA